MSFKLYSSVNTFCYYTFNNEFYLYFLPKVQRSPVVAFTALLSRDTTVGGRAVVKYDHVVTNWGGAYQPASGIFTAPFDGLYSFSCSLMSHPNSYVHLNMVKNGKIISTVFSASSTYPQSSQTLYLVLNKGDRVWMQNRNGHASTMHDGKVYNVFSGALFKDI